MPRSLYRRLAAHAARQNSDIETLIVAAVKADIAAACGPVATNSSKSKKTK
ncbi:MAG TPA: hypothetical protein VEA63_10680 [Opitutus sp.]|nr:hypothetical protein [Opitutus sp.]